MYRSAFIFMKTNTLFFRPFAVGLAISFTALSMSATDLLVHKQVANLTEGQSYTYMGHWFQANTTAFASVWDALGKMQDGDNLYFGPGEYGNITVSKNNVTLYGANAFCDAWSGKREAEESTFTGTVKIAAGIDGVTINGFQFTGNGCVRNDDAGRGSTALKNFSFIYNKCTATTLTRSSTTAIVFLGDAWRPSNSNTDHQNPTLWAANARYENVTIAHNAFLGKEEANQPACVQIAGSFGTTKVIDNHFELGGTPLSLFNTSGEFEILHNQFKNVGKGLLAAGTAKGEFCIRLFYIGARTQEPVTGNIKHNVFDGCQGQTSLYALIRFYCGDTNETVYNSNATLAINHNTFKNKTSCNDSGHNYVFYANKAGTTENSTVDWRFNHFDQSELEFAWVRPAWETSPGRYFAGSSEIFDHTTSDDETTGTGTLIDFYGTTTNNIKFGKTTPKKTKIKDWAFKSTTVVQSSDIDDLTNTWYFMQVMSTAYKNSTGKTYNSDKPTMITRVQQTTDSYSESIMGLDCAGHGSNMAVCNFDGTCYMFIGGCSPAGSSATSTKICIFPFVAGATVDVRNSTFTHGGKTYNIKHLENPISGSTAPYPSVDRDNQLFVMRTRTSTYNYFIVYNLADVFNDPANAKPIKTIKVKKYTMARTDSDRAFIAKNDKGFTTWSDQGFTISGDYIYAYEGNGDEGYKDTPNPSDASIGGDNKPVLIMNAINWRTGEYIYRKPILKTKVYADAVGTNNKQGPYSLSPGEPESVKVHRDATGHPNLLIGVVSGASNARKYNVYAYRQRRVNGQGREFKQFMPTATLTANETSLSLTSAGEVVSTTLTAKSAADVRDVQATIVGSDGACFSVAKQSGGIYSTSRTFTVTFTPDKLKKSYQAFVRLSTPGADDVLVPINVSYTGEISGVEEISIDDFNSLQLEGAQYYDINGRQLSTPTKGVNIVHLTSGKTIKIVLP